jgi:hypothetical protein
MSTVIITGSRDLQNYPQVKLALDIEHTKEPITLVVQGGANGADYLASVWARENNIPCVEVLAEWSLHGKSAGPKRNRKMLLAYPSARVIAFPKSESRGTRGCMKLAEGFGMKVVVYEL